VTATPSNESRRRLPSQVVAAAKRADDLLKPPTAATSEVVPTKEPTPVPPPAETPKPAAPPFTVEELLTAPDPDRDASVSYWKQRASVVEGYRRSERTRLESEITTLKGQIVTTRADLAQAKAAAPKDEPAIDPTSVFTADEIEAIGPERATAIVRSQQKIALEAAAKAAKAEVAPLLERAQHQQEVEAQTLQSRFVDELSAGFPAWGAVDKDSRWREFLTQKDSHTGIQRQRLIEVAKGDFDADPIVKLLNEFVTSLGAVAVPPKPPETPRNDLGHPPPAAAATPTESMRALTNKEITAGYTAFGLDRKGTRTFMGMTKEQFDARVNAQQRLSGSG
jgi:hypothetical protein